MSGTAWVAQHSMSGTTWVAQYEWHRTTWVAQHEWHRTIWVARYSIDFSSTTSTRRARAIGGSPGAGALLGYGGSKILGSARHHRLHVGPKSAHTGTNQRLLQKWYRAVDLLTGFERFSQWGGSLGVVPLGDELFWLKDTRLWVSSSQKRMWMTNCELWLIKVKSGLNWLNLFALCWKQISTRWVWSALFASASLPFGWVIFLVFACVWIFCNLSNDLELLKDPFSTWMPWIPHLRTFLEHPEEFPL